MRLPPPPVGRTPIVERALPFLSKLPYAFKIPLRNLFRAPRRTVYTIVGIAFSVSLILSSLALMDTATETMNLHFDEVQAYDLKATFSTPQSNLLSQIEGWDGVEKAEPIHEAPCRLKNGDRTYSTMLVGLDPEGGLYQIFPASEGARLTGEGILIGRELAQRLGVSVGDSVDIETEVGTRQSKVAGLVKQPLGSPAYLSLEGVRNLLGLGDSVSGALLKIEEGKLEEVKSRLYGLEQTAGVEDPEETKESVSELMDFSYEFMGVMLLFGGALAFAIVFNTVTVNILERSREIATMRTLGAGMGKIGMMLTLENLLTGALGMLLGVVLGYMLSLGYVKMFESEFLSFELAVYGRTYAITIVAILLILLLSQLPGVRYLSRLNLAKVTKEQSV
jgi:putative ABC transport system permease protein